MTKPPVPAILWSELLEAYQGDKQGARGFLRRRHPLLGMQRPGEVARSSEEGLEKVRTLLGQAVSGVAV